MVQYIFTPWRDRQELLKVRRQFYPHPPPAQDKALDRQPVEAWSTEEEAEKRNAVARVFMWMHRGNCPHVVESTALLMSAILEDRSNTMTPHSSASSSANYAVLAAYMSAFTRFVTGLLDSHQDKQRKLSMYGVAKQIGLPASFVELRHQATHEPLPPLTQLRAAARKALVWIWEYYWKNLPEDDDGSTESQGSGEGVCRQLLVAYLQSEGHGGDDKDKVMKQLRRWDDGVVLKVLSDIGDSDRQLLLKTVRLSREILGRATTDVGESTVKDHRQLRTELEQSRTELQKLKGRSMDVDEEAANPEPESGWTRYPGVWTPKPIGAL